MAAPKPELVISRWLGEVENNFQRDFHILEDGLLNGAQYVPRCHLMQEVEIWWPQPDLETVTTEQQ